MALTAKQQSFVYHYIDVLNGTEAARRAKYKGNDVTLASIASENLRKPKIREEIDRRLAVMSMSSGEIVYRLNTHARASLEQFVTIRDGGDVYVDIEKAIDAGALGNAKKITQVKNIFTDRDGNTDVSYKTSIELHDSQSALDKLAKIGGLYIHRQEVTGAEGKDLIVQFIDYGLDDTVTD